MQKSNSGKTERKSVRACVRRNRHGGPKSSALDFTTRARGHLSCDSVDQPQSTHVACTGKKPAIARHAHPSKQKKRNIILTDLRNYPSMVASNDFKRSSSMMVRQGFVVYLPQPNVILRGTGIPPTSATGSANERSINHPTGKKGRLTSVAYSHSSNKSEQVDRSSYEPTHQTRCWPSGKPATHVTGPELAGLRKLFSRRGPLALLAPAWRMSHTSIVPILRPA